MLIWRLGELTGARGSPPCLFGTGPPGGFLRPAVRVRSGRCLPLSGARDSKRRPRIHPPAGACHTPGRSLRASRRPGTRERPCPASRGSRPPARPPLGRCEVANRVAGDAAPFDLSCRWLRVLASTNLPGEGLAIFCLTGDYTCHYPFERQL